ncbi:hypothetical protein LR48_Vigan02g180500 [Vigna angularis]|uniref:Uncharacterized protein n=1 Tax=Phaseolus angularis TaxID=3914 RepID=A0A0L9TYN6_PHAAN|nr:hypothetical protein LR48_Vigan02g180500 [Vigna angularis]
MDSHSESPWRGVLCQGTHIPMGALCEWIERVALCLSIRIANQIAMRLVGRVGTLCEGLGSGRIDPCREEYQEVLVLGASSVAQVEATGSARSAIARQSF